MLTKHLSSVVISMEVKINLGLRSRILFYGNTLNLNNVEEGSFFWKLVLNGNFVLFLRWLESLMFSLYQNFNKICRVNLDKRRP